MPPTETTPSSLEDKRAERDGMTQEEREKSAGFDDGLDNGAGETPPKSAAAPEGGADEEHQSLEDLQNGEPKEGDTGEEDDGQLFVWERGRKVTLGSLVARNVPVEHVFVFGGKRIKGRGGLMGLDEAPILVVRGLSGGVKVVPTHDDEEKVVKVTIESHIASKFVAPCDSEEGVSLVGPIVDNFRRARQEGD